ncbi:MAG: hypothetical protein ACRDRI_26350 [Pseudonocardiaceae bacterium]
MEIQLRTQLQHEWVDLFEKLADRVGRGIRYGEPPEHWRDQLVSLNIKVAGEISLEGRSEDSSGDIEKVYWISYQIHELTVRLAHALPDAIDAYETATLGRSPGVLTELNTTTTDAFAGIRSVIQEMWSGPLSENS